jgi:hypothetical protein
MPAAKAAMKAAAEPSPAILKAAAAGVGAETTAADNAIDARATAKDFDIIMRIVSLRVPIGAGRTDWRKQLAPKAQF